MPTSARSEAADRLADFAEIAAEWFWEMDASLRFSFASGRLERSTGVAPAAILGRTLAELPELGSAVNLPAILARREPFDDVAFTWTPEGGPPRHLSASGRPCRDRDGAFTGYRGIGRDLTEERRALAAARESEAKLRTLVDALPVCIAYVDRDLRYGLNNETYRRWFGGSSESLRGRGIASVLGEAAWAEAQLPLECALQGETILFDQSIEVDDGAPRELQTTLVPHRGSDDEVLGSFVLSHDVGDQKRRGDRLAGYLRHLSAALDGLDAALVVLDGQGLIRTDNAAWRAMASELAGGEASSHRRYRDVCEALPVAASGANRDLVEAVEAFARGDGPSVRREIACPSVRGERWLLVTASEFHEGRERYALVAHEDVTERVLLDRRLRARDTVLAKASRLSSLGELAATLAHELNQPLTAIGNYASLASSLADGVPPGAPGAVPDGGAALGDTLDRLVVEARRAGDIVHRLNRSVRQLPAARERVDPGRIVAEVLARLATRAADARVALVADVPEGTPPLEADRVQLEQVIDNAVGNAIEAIAGANRAGTVRVGARPDDAGRRLTFEVVDDGPGFAARLDGDPFEPFVTSRPDGLGLGLAICRSIVESHGGRLERDAAPGGGARLRFALPLEGLR